MVLLRLLSQASDGYAFMESPDVLLLDEPFNALDEKSVIQITGLLRAKLAAGITVVMTSHHPSEISSLCDMTLRIRNRTIESDSA